MRHSTIIFNRQVLRLCKGILKAWEQWVDAMEYDLPPNEKASGSSESKDGKKCDRSLNS